MTRHTNFEVRLRAVEGTGNFGIEAQSVLPALTKMVTDPNGQVRRAATNALKNIEPDSAAWVG